MPAFAGVYHIRRRTRALRNRPTGADDVSDQRIELGRTDGEEGVIRSDIADVIKRAAAMSVFAYEAARDARGPQGAALPSELIERLAESTYIDVMRYSLDECSCPCHQDH